MDNQKNDDNPFSEELKIDMDKVEKANRISGSAEKGWRSARKTNQSSRPPSPNTEKAILEQRIQLLQKELKEIQEMRADEMVKQLQGQANLYNSTELNVFAEQVEKLENNNKKLQNELDTALSLSCIKFEKEKQEIISQAKKIEYSLIEENSKKDIEIQRLKLEIQKITIEKDGEFDRLRNQMELEFRELRDMYTKEK